MQQIACEEPADESQISDATASQVFGYNYNKDGGADEGETRQLSAHSVIGLLGNKFYGNPNGCLTFEARKYQAF
jgi:hypothetical protein